MGRLYLVATPIGNLEDVTLRALRILGEVQVVAAEDTRTARRLLQRHGVRARLTSYNDHNAAAKTPVLLSALAEGDVALISEAGMPGVSDPGHELVVAALAAGFEVTPIPGASAVVAAVAASGLPARRFHYLGFLPRQGGPRRRALAAVAAEPDTLVLFESPHRLQAALADLLAVLGDRQVAVCREVTKLHEEIFRGTLAQAQQRFAEPRGEFTLVVAGAGGESVALPDVAGGVDDELRRLREQGVAAREAVAQVARAAGISRREAYRRWLALS